MCHLTSYKVPGCHYNKWLFKVFACNSILCRSIHFGEALLLHIHWSFCPWLRFQVYILRENEEKSRLVLSYVADPWWIINTLPCQERKDSISALLYSDMVPTTFTDRIPKGKQKKIWTKKHTNNNNKKNQPWHLKQISNILSKFP